MPERASEGDKSSNMQKVRNLVLAGVAMMAFASCASYEKTGPIMGVQSNSVNTYVAAEFDYANIKRVEGEVKYKKLFGFINLTKNGKRYYTASNRYRGLNKAEQQALYRAKSDGNVDVIMEPNFEAENHNYLFGLYTTRYVKVKAWGLNYKGLKEDPHGNINIAR